jgi:SAM-dependent methyltransferase
MAELAARRDWGMDVSPGNLGTVDAYSQLSDADYDAIGPEGDFGRRALLNPAIFRLLGDVRGQTILDAGCGNGYLSRLLADRGGTVVGVESADVPYRYATTQERSPPPGDHVPAARSFATGRHRRSLRRSRRQHGAARHP